MLKRYLDYRAQMQLRPVRYVWLLLLFIPLLISNVPVIAQETQATQQSIYLPSIVRPSFPTVSVQFSDQLDQNGQVVNPRETFNAILRLYWQVRVTDGQGKLVRTTVSFSNSPEFTERNQIIATSPWVFTNSLGNNGRLVSPTTVRIRVYLDGQLVADESATIQ
jgi:hypothetical protein